MDKQSPKTVIITGGSSGIGQAACDYFADKGWRVFELSRSGQDREGVRHITADVGSEEEVRAAFEQIAGESDGIDVLVCNAGYGISGAVEFTGLEDAQRQFEINFFGAFLCAQQAIPIMRAQGGGRILNISSAAATFPIPYQAFYSASKAALNNYTMALANELRPFRIGVSALLLGDVQSGFSGARDKKHAGHEVYGESIDHSVAVMERDEKNGMDTRTIAAAIYQAAVRKAVPPLNTIGFEYNLFAFLYRLFPYALVNRFIGLIYMRK